MTMAPAGDPTVTRALRRKQLGSWYTPRHLVDAFVAEFLTPDFLVRYATRPLRVIDPACGDARFLAVIAEHAARRGVACELFGVDIDPAAVGLARRLVPEAHIVHADALEHHFSGCRFDVVVGNPPFLSQMAAATARGGTSRRGGGPYADAAAEFLMLASELVEPEGGRVLFVLPQSILSARDAGPVRRSIDERARIIWSWWTAERVFDAQVHTCALGFEFGGGDGSTKPANWSHVVTSPQRVPPVPILRTAGRLADVASLNANFRDEYYGMVSAVGDHGRGPRLVTSGLIDPGRSWWGLRAITFAKQSLTEPCVDLDALDDKMRGWARRRLVPKVLVANQTSIVEAVGDEAGDWLPAVPVVAIYPIANGAIGGADADAVRGIAAVLSSPIASAWSWHRSAGTGLSPTTIRLGPVVLGGLPMPAGSVAEAARALESGDVRECGRLVMAAYGVDAAEADDLFNWWATSVTRIERRAPVVL